MTDLKYMTKKATDWQVTSAGDLTLVAGIGGGVWHFNFSSAAVGNNMNFILVAGGTGGSAGIGGRIGTISEAITRIFGAASASSSYSRIACLKPFSLADIAGGAATMGTRNRTVGLGTSESMLTLDGSGLGPAGGGRLFENHPMSGSTLGLGLGSAAVGGFFMAVGQDIYEMNMQDRFNREMRRRPTDPVIRDPGGF